MLQGAIYARGRDSCRPTGVPAGLQWLCAPKGCVCARWPPHLRSLSLFLALLPAVAAAPAAAVLPAVASALPLLLLLLQDVAAYRGSWPQRVYLGMGGKEYSGVRSGRGREHDAHFPRYLKTLYAALTEQGLGPDRLAWTFDPMLRTQSQPGRIGCQRHCRLWGSGLVASWVRMQGKAGRKLCTSPGQLAGRHRGQLLFFNRMASGPWRGCLRARG